MPLITVNWWPCVWRFSESRILVAIVLTRLHSDCFQLGREHGSKVVWTWDGLCILGNKGNDVTTLYQLSTVHMEETFFIAFSMLSIIFGHISFLLDSSTLCSVLFCIKQCHYNKRQKKMFCPLKLEFLWKFYFTCRFHPSWRRCSWCKLASCAPCQLTLWVSGNLGRVVINRWFSGN